MTSLDAVTAWVTHYRAAWESNDPAAIADLFVADGVYLTSPYAAPWQGRDDIVTHWLADRDEPGTTTFDWHPLIVTEDVAMIEATTHYPDTVYSNLWVLRLDGSGQARQFTEWWMEHPKSDLPE